MGFPVFPGIPWGSPPLPDRKGRPGGVGVCTGRRRLTSFFYPVINADEPLHPRAATPTPTSQRSSEPIRRRAAADVNGLPATPTSRHADTGTDKPIQAAVASRYRQRQRAVASAGAWFPFCLGLIIQVLFWGFTWVLFGFYLWFLSVFGVGWSGDVKGWGSLPGEGKPVAGEMAQGTHPVKAGTGHAA